MGRKVVSTLIVGLGNAGGKYEFTKHNIGLLALQDLAKNQYRVNFSPKPTLAGHVAVAQTQSLVLYWPETFMNICGKNV